eukprot:SAG11_NODE_3765_length_2240_cov_35.026623_1_plen_219_part_10
MAHLLAFLLRCSVVLVGGSARGGGNGSASTSQPFGFRGWFHPRALPVPTSYDDFGSAELAARLLAVHLPRGLERAADALRHLERASALAPQEPFVHADRGVALWRAGRAEEASAAFDIAQALDAPHNHDRLASLNSAALRLELAAAADSGAGRAPWCTDDDAQVERLSNGAHSGCATAVAELVGRWKRVGSPTVPRGDHAAGLLAGSAAALCRHCAASC